MGNCSGGGGGGGVGRKYGGRGDDTLASVVLSVAGICSKEPETRVMGEYLINE